VLCSLLKPDNSLAPFFSSAIASKNGSRAEE